MKLTVKERILLPRLLPAKGSITNQTLVRDIANKVSFSKKEKTKYDLKSEKGVLTWNTNKAKDIDFTFTEIQLIKEAVKKLDDKKEITPNILDLCLKIKEYEVKK